jgi:hypothetical protein
MYSSTTYCSTVVRTDRTVGQGGGGGWEAKEMKIQADRSSPDGKDSRRQGGGGAWANHAEYYAFWEEDLDHGYEITVGVGLPGT